METQVVEIENNLDKECSVLGGLFQQIISEMKVSRMCAISDCAQ